MIAKNLINNNIPLVELSFGVQKVLKIMNDCRVQHLPVVENKKYLGIIDEYTLLENKHPKHATLEQYHEVIQKNNIAIKQHEHIYQILKTLNEYHISIIPIINEYTEYEGLITLEKTLEYFANLNAMQETGGIITLSMLPNQYSLSQIAQIVESNDAQILSMYVATLPFSNQKPDAEIEVTLKINQNNLSPIIATFERYEYNITSCFYEEEYIGDLQEKYEQFMNYLSI